MIKKHVPKLLDKIDPNTLDDITGLLKMTAYQTGHKQKVKLKLKQV